MSQIKIWTRHGNKLVSQYQIFTMTGYYTYIWRLDDADNAEESAEEDADNGQCKIVWDISVRLRGCPLNRDNWESDNVLSDTSR